MRRVSLLTFTLHHTFTCSTDWLNSNPWTFPIYHQMKVFPNKHQVLPPAVRAPHLSALWESLPTARSPSSCGCGSVLSDWGSQRVPGPELRSGTSFTGCSRAGLRSAEGRGKPSHDPCLGPPGAAVLLIRSGARAAQGGFNILKTPGQPRDLAGSGVKPPLAVYRGASRGRGGNGRCRNHWRAVRLLYPRNGHQTREQINRMRTMRWFISLDLGACVGLHGSLGWKLLSTKQKSSSCRHDGEDCIHLGRRRSSIVKSNPGGKRKLPSLQYV